MEKKKISLQMYTLRKYTGTMNDLEMTLAKLSDIGFKTIQYTVGKDFNKREVKGLMQQFGISNDSVFANFRTLKEDAQEILRDCELFETNYVRIASMPAENTGSADGYRAFAQYLSDNSASLKQAGKKLLYHFHAYEFRRFGDLCGIDILMRESDPEVVELIPDTHWIHSGGRDVVPFLEKYKDRFHYIHVKDYMIGERLEKIEYRPIYYAPVGEGNLDWQGILSFCMKKGVESYAIEQDDCYGRDPFDCVASSFRFLKNMGVD